MEGMVTGTSNSHQRVSPSSLMEQAVICGELRAFAAFDAIVRRLLDRTLAARSENRTLAETRDYLLPRLMSGEVRVREASELAEAVA
jgi:type I restriction enzyme S subunit